MGGKTLKLQRYIERDELFQIESLVESYDLTKRITLVSIIIKGLADGINTIDLSKNIVDIFDFSQSRNPIETTRANIFRIIKDLNSGLTCEEVLKKRGRGNFELEKWSDEKIRQYLKDLHLELKENFNYTEVKQRNSKLISIIEKRMKFQDALIMSGINPFVHLEDFDWGDETQSKLHLYNFLCDIEYRCGRDSLNYHSMYADQSSIVGIENDAHKSFDNCRKYGCIKRISGASIVRKMETIYGNYRNGVQALFNISDEEYSQQIERKKHNIDLEVYLIEFSSFIEKYQSDWTVSSFAERCRTAHHGIHNKKEELTFYYDCEEDAVTAAYAELMFAKSDLTKEKFVELNLSKHINEIKKRRVTNPQTRLEGYNFQSLFLDMLTSAETGLRRGIDFEYEREIDRLRCRELGHKKICKADFKFNNLIIDTKRTVRRTAIINDQLSRYMDHCDNLLIITMNQRFSLKINNLKQVEVITALDFIKNAEKYIGVKVSEQWNDVFTKYGREASLRIQKNQ